MNSRKRLKDVFRMSSLIVSLFLFMGSANWTDINDTPKEVATISVKETYIFNQPNKESNKVGSLFKGDMITIISENDDFYYVSFGLDKGFVKADDLRIIGMVEKYSKPKRAKINADNVNLRTKPSIDANIIVVLDKNTNIEVSERVSSWCKITDGKNYGYVDLSYVEFTDKNQAVTATPALKMGMSGKEVLKLQQALSDLGLFRGEVDGTYGAKTRDAVAKFESSNDLNPDGIADEIMLQTLYS